MISGKRTSKRRNGFALRRREERGLARVAIRSEMAMAIDNRPADFLSQLERVAQIKSSESRRSGTLARPRAAKSNGRVPRSDQEDLMRNDKVWNGQIAAPRRYRNRGARWRWQNIDHANQQRLKVKIGNVYLLRHPGQNGHPNNRRAAMLRPRCAGSAACGVMTTIAVRISSRSRNVVPWRRIVRFVTAAARFRLT